MVSSGRRNTEPRRAHVIESIAKLDGLPGPVASFLSGFLTAAHQALAQDLVSAVLFGSAVDGRLGPASDVNLLLVVRHFTPQRIDGIRDALLAAEAAIKLRVMFLREDEVPAAAQCFAQKFADILRRHRLLLGRDVLSALTIDRPSEIFRLRQILLNLTVRLRESYVTRGHRPEQVERILADTLGPLRAASATLLELEGTRATDSDTAFRAVAESLGAESRDAAARLYAAHDRRSVPDPGGPALPATIALAAKLYERASRLT
jgi:hypothetical protein